MRMRRQEYSSLNTVALTFYHKFNRESKGAR